MKRRKARKRKLVIMSQNRSGLGRFVGIITFLGGIVLLLITFFAAYSIFTLPVDQLLQVKSNQPINLENAGASLVSLLIRTLVLGLMCIVAAVITSRGIKMHASSIKK